MITTAGQLLVNEALPEDLRNYTQTLGQDEINALLRRLAEEHPDKYKDVAWRLVQLGRNAAFDEGSTITLNDLVPVVDKSPLIDLVKQKEREIRSSRTLTQDQKDEAIETLYGEASKRLTDETYANALAINNPFALQAKYKARGNKNQLGAMLTSPGTYTDSEGKIVPIFISSAYSEGLKPHEYWAAGYGARLGVVSTKLGTQKGGYLSKLMNATAIDQVVTEDDCGTTNGVPVDASDNDSVGSVLQHDVAGFKAGTVITKKVLDKIRADGNDEILVRSPITCNSKNGLCKRCVGIRETGRFPDIGYNVGVNAASALGEQIAQNSLNCLAEGTLVRMADGKAKPIEDIVVGDWVIGCDMEGNFAPTRVTATYDNGIQPCLNTMFVAAVQDGVTTHEIVAYVQSTRIHEFLCYSYTDNGAVCIGAPNIMQAVGDGNYMYAAGCDNWDESTTKTNSVFSRVEQLDIGDRHVYDITVSCDSHIFLLANGLVCKNTKHSGKRSDLGSYVGFDALKNLSTIPKAYDVKASVASRDGVVTAIEAAPQGGSYVVVDNDPDDKVYVPASLDVSVKEGDRLEAGDAVSTGLVSPADVVQYKGVGEGRRYFTSRFTKVFKDSSYGVNRRNVEVLSRALVNNVQVENPDSEGDALPGDIVRYSAWAGAYTPRDGAETLDTDKSVGRYLEAPVLHYTIGTRITPSVAKRLKKYGHTSILTNKTAPGVVPHMVSMVEAPAYSDDWMARLGTSYLKDRLLEDVQQGSTSKAHGINPVPSLAKGVSFGNDIRTKGLY